MGTRYYLLSLIGGDYLDFELAIEELEEVTPKHPINPGCSSKPFKVACPYLY
jgi:hypothetical protein